MGTTHLVWILGLEQGELIYDNMRSWEQRVIEPDPSVRTTGRKSIKGKKQSLRDETLGPGIEKLRSSEI